MYITSEQRSKLAQGLFDKMMAMRKKGVTAIKNYEVEFQGVIESVFNNMEWFDVTECRIFDHLLEHKDPEKTVIEILKQLKED